MTAMTTVIVLTMVVMVMMVVPSIESSTRMIFSFQLSMAFILLFLHLICPFFFYFFYSAVGRFFVNGK